MTDEELREPWRGDVTEAVEAYNARLRTTYRIEALRAAVRWMPVALADEPVVEEVLDIAEQFARWLEVGER